MFGLWHWCWLWFYPSDMLQLINNQEMEFEGLFDNPPYTGLPPPQDSPGLTQGMTPAPPTITTTAPPSSSSSSILSSSPHLDALLGPPIKRNSSNCFLFPTFQQSPLTQVSNPIQRQQTSTPKALSVEQPQTNLSPSSPVQASSPHSSPGPNPGITSTPQGLSISPAPQSPPQAQVQTQSPAQQAQISYINKNSHTGKCIWQFKINKGMVIQLRIKIAQLQQHIFNYMTNLDRAVLQHWLS